MTPCSPVSPFHMPSGARGCLLGLWYPLPFNPFSSPPEDWAIPGATHTMGSISSIFLSSSGDSCMCAGGVGSSALADTRASPPSPAPTASGCWWALDLTNGSDPGGNSGMGPLVSTLAVVITLVVAFDESFTSPPFDRSLHSADRRMETTRPPLPPFCCAVGSLTVGSPLLSHH